MKSKRKGRHRLVKVVAIILALVLLLGGALLLSEERSKGKGVPTNVDNFEALLSLPEENLARMDIAKINLLCAEGLPGAEKMAMELTFETLDKMAERVRSETLRHLHRFQNNPAEFDNSEGFFRMLLMSVVLAEDFQVRYVPGKIGTVADARIGDGFFADARDVFLLGVAGPRRLGTCSSLPVLQVAVGRRLGYPVNLVATKGHLFVRWEDARERFNVDAAGKGVNRLDDEYYRHWPAIVTDEDIQAEQYLKSLTARGELAVFLSIRGSCWREAGQYLKAAESFRQASRLAPSSVIYRALAVELEQMLPWVDRKNTRAPEGRNETRGFEDRLL